MIREALALAARGFRVIPLHTPFFDTELDVYAVKCSCGRPGCGKSAGKHPRLDSWQTMATTDPRLIKCWWGSWPDANIGLAMGGPQRVIAIDIDGALGRQTLAALEFEHGSLPDTLVIVTGRDEGGEDRLFRVPDEWDLSTIPNGVGSRAGVHPGIDVRAVGGQIVAPPSHHYSGRRYAWGASGIDAPIAPLPRWLYDLLSAPKREPEARTTLPPTSQRREVIPRASAYLAKIPPAIEGSHGGTQTFYAAMCMVRGFELSEEEAHALLAAEYNPRCIPPWPDRDLRRKVHEAATKGEMVWGSLLDSEAGGRKASPGNTSRNLERDGGGSPAGESGDTSSPSKEGQHVGRAERRPLLKHKQGALKVGGSGAPAIATAPEVEPSGVETSGVSTPQTSRPPVKMSPELSKMVLLAMEVIGTDPDVYQRDGKLVTVVRIAETDKDALKVNKAGNKRKGWFAPGTPCIRKLTTANVQHRLTALAQWLRWDERAGQWVARTPSKDVAQALLDLGEWPTVRPLTGILEAPSLRLDGSIAQEPGYDQSTGYLYLPSCDFPPVPEAPTQAEAAQALRDLCEVWCDFPFAETSTDVMRYVPIAALLTLLARPAIDGNVPAFLLDAPTKGSGKTLATDAVSIIATGRAAAKKDWPGDHEEEVDKVLGGYALRGAAMIVFDNVMEKHAFGGGAIDRVLTADGRVDLRVLGKSEVPSVDWYAVIFGTGNNMAICGDTSRRVLLCRIDPKMEHPEDRTGYQHPQLGTWLKAERPRLVVAALIILRAFVSASHPSQGVPAWGSFEAWRDLIAQAIVYAGGADVLGARLRDDAHRDRKSQALRTIVERWPQLAPQGATVKSVLETLYPRERLRGDSNLPPDGFEAVRDAIEELVRTIPGKMPSPRSLGMVFTSARERIIAGHRLSGEADRNGVIMWRAISAIEG